VLTTEGLDGLPLPPEPDLWVLTFRPEVNDVPPPIRIRRLLKYAGRVLGLKCVEVRDAKPGELDRAEGVPCGVASARGRPSPGSS
jgi:hypothetical protein